MAFVCIIEISDDLNTYLLHLLVIYLDYNYMMI